MRYAPNSIPFTKSGYDELIHERQALQTRRPQAVIELARARDEGDRSENAAYKAARWELSGIDKRLRYLTKLIDNAKICIPEDNQTIQIGNTVHLSSNSKHFTYQIVGEHEADPQLQKISHKSPVGSALMHHKIGDQITVTTPGGQIKYTINQISL